jgi:hypothetical protein
LLHVTGASGFDLEVLAEPKFARRSRSRRKEIRRRQRRRISAPIRTKSPGNSVEGKRGSDTAAGL